MRHFADQFEGAARTRFRITLAATVCLVLTAGCSKSILMPTPVAFTGGRADPFAGVAPEKQTNTLDVFYATTRAGRGDADDRTYNNDVSTALQLGTANVRLGDRNTTWRQLVDASLSGDRARSIPVTVTRAAEFGTLSRASDGNQQADAGGSSFAAAINRDLENVIQREISIYVHGVLIDFNEAISVGAELRHFLGQRQVVVSYVWPCRQRLVNYPSDIERAKGNGAELARFIEFLAAHTGAAHINLLGYSAGATLVVEGLVELKRRHPDWDERQFRERLRIGNVILAAADVDLNTFVRQQLVEIAKVTQYLEITVSENDKALSLASRLRGDTRLGRPDVEELTREDLEQIARVTNLHVIDVSDVPGPHSEGSGFGGHGYWYANPWVSSDILVTLIWQLPPDRRGLVQAPGRRTWTFPPDYPDRVQLVVANLMDELRDRGRPVARTGGAAGPASAPGPSYSEWR